MWLQVMEDADFASVSINKLNWRNWNTGGGGIVEALPLIGDDMVVLEVFSGAKF